jgi:hypothetical protein
VEGVRLNVRSMSMRGRRQAITFLGIWPEGAVITHGSRRFAFLHHAEKCKERSGFLFSGVSQFSFADARVTSPAVMAEELLFFLNFAARGAGAIFCQMRQ